MPSGTAIGAADRSGNLLCDLGCAAVITLAGGRMPLRSVTAVPQRRADTDAAARDGITILSSALRKTLVDLSSPVIVRLWPVAAP